MNSAEYLSGKSSPPSQRRRDELIRNGIIVVRLILRLITALLVIKTTDWRGGKCIEYSYLWTILTRYTLLTIMVSFNRIIKAPLQIVRLGYD